MHRLENLHRQLIELDEIADGAYSDGPMRRGIAKRKADEIRAEITTIERSAQPDQKK